MLYRILPYSAELQHVPLLIANDYALTYLFSALLRCAQGSCLHECVWFSIVDTAHLTGHELGGILNTYQR